MNDLRIFESEQFGKVRTIEIDGTVYFVASDVAKSLGYTNTSKAINDHCRWVTKRYIPHPQNPVKTLEVNVIPQGDVVRLATHSELPGAEKFESWIYDEVIPNVLNHGMYAIQSKNTIEEGLKAVKFIADDMRVSESSRLFMYENYCKDVGIPTGFLPKYEDNGNRERCSATVLLKRNGCNMGTAKFNELMIARGYMEIKERPSKTKGTKSYKSLTDKGLKYGVNLICDKNQKETQPYYYADTFMELYNLVV